IEMPIVMLCHELEKAGEQEDLKTVKDLFRCHADQLIEIGTAYPASEVNYEQSIVQPAAEVILQVYEVTGEEKYLRGAEQQIAVLELFDGQQPDYHLHETAIRHWDGYCSENAESSEILSRTTGVQKTVEPSSATLA
ncbi:MAG: hypothetical protein ACLUI5_15525, partial [Fusicatenibacter saccharivorans]